ncbi:hypothetical protein FRC12_017291 [Ceratobasidium sp. 428]|nr:hypothetical protein FRC12_017291 [Ceratobasidium sp. 428]
MTISSGTYRIRNSKSHTILDLSRKDGHEIHGWQQHDQNNQHWYVRRTGDGYVIQNVESGDYASVNGNQNGSKLRGSKNECTWNLIPKEDNHFMGVPGTNQVADMDMGRSDNGTTVHLWERTGANQQRWQFEKINDNPGSGGGGGGYHPPPQQQYQQPQQPQQQYQQPQQQPQQPQQPPPQQQPQQPQQPPQQQGPVSPGTYILKNVKTGTVIDLNRGQANEGADVFGYDHNGGNNQKWQIQPTGHGQNFTIRNLETNTYAAFPGQSFAQGVLVKASSQPQEYTFAAADKGIFICPTQQPGYVLDLVHGSEKNGTKICVWQNNQQDNQKWYFERA